MDLSLLIPSKVRRLVLEYFCLHPDAKIHVNAMARELKSSPQLIHRELINLENLGMLFSFARGNQRTFEVNKRFLCWPPLRDMFKIIEDYRNTKFEVDRVIDSEEFMKQKGPSIDPELIKAANAGGTIPKSWGKEKMLKRLELRLLKEKKKTVKRNS